MGNQQSFSHGLLYSVAPENFSELHLRDEDDREGFDWDGGEAQRAGEAVAQFMLDFLKSLSRR